MIKSGIELLVDNADGQKWLSWVETDKHIQRKVTASAALAIEALNTLYKAELNGESKSGIDSNQATHR
jgi:hypothetical protein